MAELRIGDAEREQAAARLGEHVGAGRLDLAEYEQRVDRVYAARTRAELDAVTADLPAAPRPAPQRPFPVPPRMPRMPVAAIWAPWALASVICLVIWVATSVGAGRPLPFWPVWVFGPWGAVLLLGTLTGSLTGRAGCRAVSR
ncbi:DUF1707 domain-containing protein [Pseudonocardia ailaonensis]|uniref:DUF1707 domain-containing protein n=1 Tax=Pseudonocardia ailaonensis TaxID=367279 RepID=A0ABN2MSJ1_9PSEU